MTAETRLDLNDEQRGVWPEVSVAHRLSTTWKRPTELALDSDASPRAVEILGRPVLVEHPQVNGTRWPMLKKSESSLRHQMRADPHAFQIAPDMQIVEKGSPFRVVVEHDMSEAEDSIITFGDHGALVDPRTSKATCPDLKTISDDIPVKV
jgi:hypothetical protein